MAIVNKGYKSHVVLKYLFGYMTMKDVDVVYRLSPGTLGSLMNHQGIYEYVYTHYGIDTDLYRKLRERKRENAEIIRTRNKSPSSLGLF